MADEDFEGVDGPETTGLLGDWSEELNRRQQVAYGLQEKWAEELSPVLAYTEGVSTELILFDSEDALRSFMEGLGKAVEAVTPTLLESNSGWFKTADIVDFFREVCGVPNSVSRGALLNLENMGRIYLDEERYLRARENTAT